MNKLSIPLLLTGLLLVGASASAQTALIAHRSHGGAARTFRPAKAGADNFGIATPHYEPQKIVWLRGSEAVFHMLLVQEGSIPAPKTRLDTVNIEHVTGTGDAYRALQELRQQYPKAQFIGFDSKKFRAGKAGR